MSCDPSGRTRQNQLLGDVLRSIRRLRRRRSRELAAAMQMPLRSYEHFESAAGRINLDRIQDFAHATDSDPYAILAALFIHSPRFALRAADNKLMTAFLITLQEFDERVGDGLGLLETSLIMAAFSQAFETLAIEVGRKARWKDGWLDWAKRSMSNSSLAEPAGLNAPSPLGEKAQASDAGEDA
jgi:hypothetical protein